MKKAEEIFKENAIYMGGSTWILREEKCIKVMKEYAKQVAEQALKDASENAIMYCIDREPEGIDKESIINTPIQLP